MDYELPVYEQGDWLASPVLGGPRLRAPRPGRNPGQGLPVSESAGYVHDVDEVTVGVVRPRDLRRVKPAAVFRSHEDDALWIPSAEGTSPEGSWSGWSATPRAAESGALARGGGPGR